jgi:hypothetical protein
MRRASFGVRPRPLSARRAATRTYRERSPTTPYDSIHWVRSVGQRKVLRPTRIRFSLGEGADRVDRPPAMRDSSFCRVRSLHPAHARHLIGFNCSSPSDEGVYRRWPSCQGATPTGGTHGRCSAHPFVGARKRTPIAGAAPKRDGLSGFVLRRAFDRFTICASRPGPVRRPRRDSPGSGVG